MRDLVFGGRDLAEALAAAGTALGVPVESLRYIVLDDSAGTSAAASVRVAVLMERGRAAAPEPAPSGPDHIREALEALAEAAGIELVAELRENAEEIEVRLSGAGTETLLENAGEVVRSVDHILRRTLHLAADDRRFSLICEGYRELREAALRERAQALAAAVLADGRTRYTEPLNSYERRTVHLALSDVAGVRTTGVGAGGDRRVAVERLEAPASEEGR